MPHPRRSVAGSWPCGRMRLTKVVIFSRPLGGRGPGGSHGYEAEGQVLMQVNLQAEPRLAYAQAGGWRGPGPEDRRRCEHGVAKLVLLHHPCVLCVFFGAVC